MPVALLDGDSWVYRCGFAAEKTYYLVEEPDGTYRKFQTHKEAKDYYDPQHSYIWSRKEIEPLENCLQMVKTSLENTLNVLGTSQRKIYLSGRRSFRDDVFSDYKGNRDGMAKPKYYRDIRDYLVGAWGAVVVDGIEADDALGIEAGSNKDCVIVAVDKDLDQIPGDHYNWTKGERYVVTQKGGLRFFYEQLLSGDPTDNVPGIPGIGPVKAKKALEECKTPNECALTVERMYREYLEQGAGVADTNPREIIDRNATLLWIQREKDQKHPFWKHYETK